MKRLIVLIFSLIAIGVVVPANAYAPFMAQPLYLNIYPIYTVINVVNTTYIGATSYFHNNVTEIVNFVAHNSTMKIELYNATTGVQIGCISVIIPPQFYKYVYYSPQYGSAIFLINVTDNDTFYKVPVAYLHLGLYSVENASGYNVNCIYEIPIGSLYTLSGGVYVYVNTTSFFNKYLNGVQTITSDVKADIEGVYAFIFVS
ncbi:hypothetical protein [Stygiolobus caldivivus]|uniref:Uncharacterized protein n=1 Tax=Stygiolobus caldivivus TaxID=2824673 RepID=A0A8D5ZKM3_9CREN|nr:hypothetical protein [Stygiolobus caldivivus]BCU71432.1 hypothetical protein KN1_27290 [Stygiolobus caldivivus]